MGKSFRRLRLRKMMAAKAAQVQAAQAAQVQAAQANAKAEAEKQALAKAGAITDSGRKTDVVNDTTETPGVVQNQPQADRPANSADDLTLYINDMRNRRRNKGAALPQLSGVLGQAGALGV